MKIVVSAKAETVESEVDPRFGRAACFLVFDTGREGCQAVSNRGVQAAAHGAGIQAAETVCRLGADAVISGHVGPKAFAVLAAAGVKVYHTDPRPVQDAVEAFRRGELKEQSGQTGV